MCIEINKGAGHRTVVHGWMDGRMEGADVGSDGGRKAREVKCAHGVIRDSSVSKDTDCEFGAPSKPSLTNQPTIRLSTWLDSVSSFLSSVRFELLHIVYIYLL